MSGKALNGMGLKFAAVSVVIGVYYSHNECNFQ